MKAAVYHGRRDIRIEDVPEPPAPAAGELALDVLRAAICGTDAAEFERGPRQIPLSVPHPANGQVGPMTIGHEFMGRIRALGEGVTGFAVGDRVVCGAGISCGECSWCAQGRTNLCSRYYTLGLQADGGLAERVNAPASICVAVPDEIDDDAAALAQPQSIALHILNRSRATAGDAIALIGVGGIGALVAAAAVNRGLRKIIAVDVDEARLSAASALGVQHLVNAAETDPVAEVRRLTDDVGVDAALELSGADGSPERALQMVRRGGRVVIAGLPHAPVPLDLHDATMRELDLITSNAHVAGADLPEAIEVLGRPLVADTVIDRVIGLDDLVEHGIRALLDGSARGKILIDPRPTAS